MNEKEDQSGRADFTERVKRLLADRSGYRCSFPGCGKPTIGPGSESEEVSSIGVAAHIFSAAPGGPRGTGQLPKSSLASVDNGIWLCAKHARIVDANQGNRYPPGKLKSFKLRHEARCAMELGHRPFVWIDELRIKESRLFKAESRMRLGKVVFDSWNEWNWKDIYISHVEFIVA